MRNSIQSAEDIDETVRQFSDMLFRICLVYLENDADAQDAIQDAFIKYMLRAPEFSDDEHKKAWLITVAVNNCKDIIRSKKRKNECDLSAVINYVSPTSESESLNTLLSLPDRYRLVLQLYYVEGYHVNEIARMLGKSESAIKMRLKRGRNLLDKII